MQNNKVREDLLNLSTNKYKNFQCKLVPNISNIMGVSIPNIRKYSKGLTYDEKLDYINNYDYEYLEEIILMGLIICDLKLPIEEILKYTEKYINLIDNWCSCDIFCSSFHITNQNKNIIFSFIQKYLNSNNEFYIRFSLVMLINYFICDEYIDEVFRIIDNVWCSKYYDKMALAWLISMVYIKYKDRTISYLKNCNLDKFTYNKSIQKIIESNKVSKEEKDFIRLLKK